MHEHDATLAAVALLPTGIVAEAYEQLAEQERALLAQLTERQRLVLSVLAEATKPFYSGTTAADLFLDVAAQYPKQSYSGVGVGSVLGALAKAGLARRDVLTDCDGKLPWRATPAGVRLGAALQPHWPDDC